MTAGQASDCFVCCKHRGETNTPGGAIYEDELVYAGHAEIRPGFRDGYLGYLMVEPKRHVRGFAGLNDQEAAALGQLVAHLSRALEKVVAAEHVYAFVLGHHVDHLHLHLVPRYPGAPREYWGVHVDEWPDAPHGDAAAITELCDQLRRYLPSGR